MPFTIRKQDHVPTTAPSIGARTGFGANFSASFNRQYSVDSAFGYEEELHDAYEENFELANRLAGTNLKIEGGLNKEQRGKLNHQLTELKALYPDIKTLDDVQDQHRLAAQKIINEQERTGARASWPGFFGELAGGMVAGAAPWRDPLYAATLLMGAGLGRSLATKMITEAFIGGATETVQQAAFTAPRYRREGLEGNNAVMNIVSAAVGGAAIRGLFEIPAPILRKVEQSVRPEAVQNRKINAAVQELLGPTVEVKGFRERINDEDLLQIVEKFPRGNDRDLAVSLLTHRIKEKAATPHPDTRAGRLDTEAEIQQAQADITGEQPSPTIKKRAAEAKVINDEAVAQRAKETDPVLFKNLAEVEKEVKELEAKFEALKAKEITEADVIQRINAKKGARMKSLGKQLAKTLSRPKTKKLKEELAAIRNEYTPQKRSAIKRKMQKELEKELANVNGALRKARGKHRGIASTARQVRRKVATEMRKAAKANTAKAPRNSTNIAEQEIELETELTRDELDSFIARMQPDENGDMNLGMNKSYSAEFLEIQTEDGNRVKASAILEEFKEDDALLTSMGSCLKK